MDELIVLAFDVTLTLVDLELLSREFFAWSSTTRVLLCGNQGTCDDYPAEFVDKAQTVRVEIVRSMIEAFERALANHDDVLVSSLIAEVEQLGSDAKNPDEVGFYAAFLVELAQPPGINLDKELRRLYASQLIIEMIDFPEELGQVKVLWIFQFACHTSLLEAHPI